MSTPDPIPTGWLKPSLDEARREAARIPQWARQVLAARERQLFPDHPVAGGHDQQETP